MVRIEVELQGSNVQDNIFDLRNYLKENIPDTDFFIKDQPAADGQMGDMEHLIGGILHASTAILIEELYHNLLKPLLKAWLKGRNNAGLQLEVMSSLSGNDEKVHFLEDTNGNTQVFNFRYAIDTDKTFVLLIGAGKFTNGFNAIPPVKGNLEDFYKLLTDKKHIGIPRDRVVISYNEPHVEIQKQLLQASRMQDLQTLIIYFAGHGHRTDVKKLTLIAADTEKIGDDVIGGIDFDFISSKVLKNAVASQKILILDTCHSGIATQGSDDVAVNFDVKGSYILTSSPGDEVSYFEKNAKHTYFTGALLDVLKNGIDNTNDMLALEDLFDYTKDVLSEKDFPHPNSKSELNIPAANFFIARNPSFSGEKLKWRAANLLRDGKMEEAMNEFRLLLKRFPKDENLRKQFEECETELSFSKLVNEANALFYQAKNYQQASGVYKRAYQLKKDAMVMEKIRQCELQPPPVPGPDPLAPVKANPNFIAFQKAADRKSFYTACQYLKKLKQAFPASNYVNEELTSAEALLNKIADSRHDERLATYFQLVEKGEPQQAMAELRIQISNDPEYPVFLKLQQVLSRSIKQKQGENNEEKESLLFRLFKTLSKNMQVITIAGIAALLIVVFVIYKGTNGNHSIAELRAMLVSAPAEAMDILKEKAAKDDSAKLVLGDYYLKSSRYKDAYAIYLDAELPAAKSAIGKMFYDGSYFYKINKDSAAKYFKDALRAGSDTTASYYLAMIALDKYKNPLGNSFDDIFTVKDNWKEAADNFKEGYKNNCMRCKDSLTGINFNRGYALYKLYKYTEAYPYLSEAAFYKMPRAMYIIGNMYADTSWKKYDYDDAIKWYKAAAEYNYSSAFGGWGYLVMKNNFTKASNDTAYNLFMKQLQFEPINSGIFYNLGIIFEIGGVVVPRRKDSAIYYYHLAADYGLKLKAEERLKNLEIKR